jgi:hypothetical protein
MTCGFGVSVSVRSAPTAPVSRPGSNQGPPQSFTATTCRFVARQAAEVSAPSLRIGPWAPSPPPRSSRPFNRSNDDRRSEPCARPVVFLEPVLVPMTTEEEQRAVEASELFVRQARRLPLSNRAARAAPRAGRSRR